MHVMLYNGIKIIEMNFYEFFRLKKIYQILYFPVYFNFN